jgi:hypothetical protein
MIRLHKEVVHVHNVFYFFFWLFIWCDFYLQLCGKYLHWNVNYEFLSYGNLFEHIY